MSVPLAAVLLLCDRNGSLTLCPETGDKSSDYIPNVAGSNRALAVKAHSSSNWFLVGSVLRKSMSGCSVLLFHDTHALSR